jgi:hypothetical protein
MRTGVGVLCVLLAIVIATQANEQQSLAAPRLDSWRCLASEVVAMLPTKMSGQDFAAYVKGKCLTEQQSFRAALTAYFAKTMPSETDADHRTAADLVIHATQDDAASAYDGLNR